jgi:hypothetical protein
LKFQLKDYCYKQNNYFNKHKAQLKAFWVENLKGFDRLIDINFFYKSLEIRNQEKSLTFDKPDFHTARELDEILDREETAVFSTVIVNLTFTEIKALAHSKYLSINAILYTSFYLLIHNYAKKTKILLAALIADRANLDNKDIIGCLLGGTYLPISIEEGYVINHLIEEVYSIISTGVQNVIFSHNSLELDMELRTSCDMYLNYISLDEPFPHDELEQLKNEHQPEQGIYYALNCVVNEFSNGISIKWKYNKTLFTSLLIEDMVDCHERILNYIILNTSSTVKDLGAFIKCNG